MHHSEKGVSICMCDRIESLFKINGYEESVRDRPPKRKGVIEMFLDEASFQATLLGGGGDG